MISHQFVAKMSFNHSKKEASLELAPFVNQQLETQDIIDLFSF